MDRPTAMVSMLAIPSIISKYMVHSQRIPYPSLQVFSQPLQECLVPQLAVGWLQYPVAFVRKVEHLGRNAETLQVGEKLKTLANGNPEVQLAVDHKHRRFEILRVVVR